MSKFTKASAIEEVVWCMKIADYPRSTNRARIDHLFNGGRPFTDEEQAQNRIVTNVNFLDSTRIAHDMRRQFSQAFLRPGKFFTVKCDYGLHHRRQQYSTIITENINRVMKRGVSARRYRETQRNVFGQVTLHGVGPKVWQDKQSWCPSMQQMCDVMIPSGTYLTMENLSYFAVYRRYTVEQLWRMTHGPKVDAGWQMDVVDKCIEWARKQYGNTVGGLDTLYSPERWQEALKSDSGLYSIDAIPTINCWDFYFLNDDDKNYGWKRRIVLDTPDAPTAGSASTSKNILGERNQFLYNPGNRNYASTLDQIIHFQFADGSVVAPFRYHSVRSLGFLLYAVCHLQNRLRCKFNDSVFESLLNYFRVANPNDSERLEKLDLVNLGIIPDGLTFVTRNERWNIDHQLVNTAMALNRQSMADNSTSFTQDFGHAEENPQDKTATQITAEVNASTALVGSMLNEAYGYEEYAYREQCRRFCIVNSKDPDVRQFRLDCLRDGLPEEALDASRWDVSAERVIGAGNKQLEGAMIQSLMQNYQLYEPDAQRRILQLATFFATDDAALTEELTPTEQNLITNSVHDAQVSAGAMLLGLPLGLKQGVNHGEYAATLLGMMNTLIQKIDARGGVATEDEIAGLQNLAGQTVDGQPIEGNGAMAHIQILAQDKESKQEVKQLGDVLGKLMNTVKAYVQRLEEQQQQQAQGNGQPQIAPEDLVKLRGQMLLSEAKAANMRDSHAQRAQQKAEIHQQQMEEARGRDELSNAAEIRKTQVQEAATDIKTASEIRREGVKPETVV